MPTIAFFAAITATFGNLAAYPQTNLKRLLAYSTIAHAGYMMMGLATLTTAGAAAVLFYLVAYLFMNLGAFAVVAFIRNLTGSEDLNDLRGLIYRAPVLVITLGIFLLSLLGLPPLAGFAAKFQIFAVLYQVGPGVHGRGPSRAGERALCLAGDRRHQHGLQPGLLCPRPQGDDYRAAGGSGGGQGTGAVAGFSRCGLLRRRSWPP